MAFLSYKEDDHPREIEITGEDLTIGRSHDCTIQITDDTEISRFHCSVQRYSDGSYWLLDTASKNGTFLNGKRVLNEETKLNSGDVIRVGRTKLTFSKGRRCNTTRAFEEAQQDLEQGRGVNDVLDEIRKQRDTPASGTSPSGENAAANKLGEA